MENKHAQTTLATLLLRLRLRRHLRRYLDRLLSRRKRSGQALRGLHLVRGGLLVNLYASRMRAAGTLQDRLKGSVNASGVVGRGLNKHHAVLLREGNCFLRLDGTLVHQIALVADLGVKGEKRSYQHDDHVAVRVLLQLREPLLHILKGRSRCDIIYDECADSSAVIPTGEGRERCIRAGDCAIPFLTRYTSCHTVESTGIPDLRFDDLVVNSDTLGSELDANSGL